MAPDRDYWLNSPDWVSVQPRSMREHGQRRRTPGYLTDISDTKSKLTVLTATLIAFRAAASNAINTDNSLTITKPAATAEGDLLIAGIAISVDDNIQTPPTGWTLVTKVEDANSSLHVYWKTAGASEPANYTWTKTGATINLAGGIIAFKAVHATPVDVSGDGDGSNTAPSVTTTVDDAMVVTFHMVEANATWTAPAGMTEAFDTTDGIAIACAGYYVAQPTAGATGTKAATPTSGTGHSAIVALTPTSDVQTLVTPTTGTALRIIRIKVSQPTSDGVHFAELYFGAAANAAAATAAAGGVVDLLKVPDQGDDTTRTWARGHGPAGAVDTAITLRFKARTQTDHEAFVEYTEET